MQGGMVRPKARGECSQVEITAVPALGVVANRRQRVAVLDERGDRAECDSARHGSLHQRDVLALFRCPE